MTYNFRDLNTKLFDQFKELENAYGDMTEQEKDLAAPVMGYLAEAKRKIESSTCRCGRAASPEEISSLGECVRCDKIRGDF